MKKSTTKVNAGVPASPSVMVKQKGRALQLNVQKPFFNVVELEKEYNITVTSPGLCKADFEVTINKQTLLINAHRLQHASEAKVKKVLRLEYDYSDWQINLRLPNNADALFTRACYTSGELIFNVPKNRHPIVHSGNIKVQIY
jgi:HSP20 family molecular chaperone IbpA